MTKKKLLPLICCLVIVVQLNGQVLIDRETKINSTTEAFGIRKTISPFGGFGNIWGGMYMETNGCACGKPYYGYAINGTSKAYHYYDGADAGWHLNNTNTAMSIWPDSMQWETSSGERLFFPGHRLSYGKNGNTISGFRATLADVSTNIGNTVMGWNAARDMTTGVSNTAIGFFAGESLIGGDFNTMVGTDAGRDVSNGHRNTFVGYWAGRNTGTTSVGNIFLGYRAGQNETGSNKLYIANSETNEPLIYGDFASGDIKMYADAIITGNTGIAGNATVGGNTLIAGNTTIIGATTINSLTTINSQLTTQDIKIDDSDPFLDFKQLGTTKYYFQYKNNEDRFILHESGLGDVLEIKDGGIYFPQLTGLAGKSLKINETTGKLEVDPDPTTFTYYGSEFYNHSNEDKIKDVTKDLINGMTINYIVCQYDWDQAGNAAPIPSAMFLSRVDRSTGNTSNVYTIPSPGAGWYNAEFSSPTNPHIVDTDNYNYYLITTSLLTTIMQVRIE